MLRLSWHGFSMLWSKVTFLVLTFTAKVHLYFIIFYRKTLEPNYSTLDNMKLAHSISLCALLHSFWLIRFLDSPLSFAVFRTGEVRWERIRWWTRFIPRRMSLAGAGVLSFPFWGKNHRFHNKATIKIFLHWLFFIRSKFSLLSALRIELGRTNCPRQATAHTFPI